MCATTSVSVSLENSWPDSISFFFNSAQFSTIPLWTTTTSPLESV